MSDHSAVLIETDELESKLSDPKVRIVEVDEDTSLWKTVSRSNLKAADAMVYRSGGAGHIFLYTSGDGWGSMYAYECKGCSYGCVAGYRTVPLVDGEGRPFGVVTSADVIRWLASLFPEAGERVVQRPPG